MDKLDEIFDKQSKLQRKLGMVFNQEYINIMVLSIQNELHEVLRETPWKPWKKTQSMNRANYVSELADVLHFFINLCLAVNVTPRELFDAYDAKNQENYKRQEREY